MDPEADTTAIAASLTSPAAFAAVFDRHYSAVHRYLARRVGQALADDLASETFTVAFDARARYDAGRPDAGPWHCDGIATNLLRHHRRAEARRIRAYARLERGSQAAGDHGVVDAQLDAMAAAPALADALSRIPDRDRDALLLLAWADLTYDEIAAALGIPIGTVRSRIHRARGRLRELLGASGQGVVDDIRHEVLADG